MVWLKVFLLIQFLFLRSSKQYQISFLKAYLLYLCLPSSESQLVLTQTSEYLSCFFGVDSNMAIFTLLAIAVVNYARLFCQYDDAS